MKLSLILFSSFESEQVLVNCFLSLLVFVAFFLFSGPEFFVDRPVGEGSYTVETFDSFRLQVGELFTTQAFDATVVTDVSDDISMG